MSHFDVHIFCCTNERDPDHPRPSCGRERGEEIQNRFKQMLRRHGVAHSRANKSLCLDRCELGPCVVVYPEGVWYRIDDIDTDVEAIVTEHIVGGEPVARLRLPNERES